MPAACPGVVSAASLRHPTGHAGMCMPCLPKSMSGAAMPWLPPPTGNYLELLRKLLKITYNYFGLLLNYIVEHRSY
jgi:hypothetical protein